ncbi:FAD-dependent monooxygenase [uncultured Sulfitobacter sp.]|uniref:FAD-dependent monooxygenase n=1 Tax=uncultured Sulfitobacter sp. TaxID=191468 RepID=UPI00262DC27B|nr:FAD-dependent monooxygenase [uncultured Sulfitobacter sp.]
MYNLQQLYIEQLLWQAATAHPLIEMRWQSEVVGIEDTNEGAQLTVRDPNGDYIHTAAWVLACDGARSPIRKFSACAG